MAQPERQRVGHRSLGAEPGCRRPLTGAASLFQQHIHRLQISSVAAGSMGISRIHAFCLFLQS